MLIIVIGICANMYIYEVEDIQTNQEVDSSYLSDHISAFVHCLNLYTGASELRADLSLMGKGSCKF